MLDALAQAKTPAEWLRVMSAKWCCAVAEQDNFSALAVWCSARPGATSGARTESPPP
jgi:hypothetical protein